MIDLSEIITFTLKQAREYRDKTQDEMADMLGIHHQTYRKLENNPDIVTVKQAKEISLFLKIPYDIIFFGKNSSLASNDKSELGKLILKKKKQTKPKAPLNGQGLVSMDI